MAEIVRPNSTPQTPNAILQYREEYRHIYFVKQKALAPS